MNCLGATYPTPKKNWVVDATYLAKAKVGFGKQTTLVTPAQEQRPPF